MARIKQNSPFELLKRKKILGILDGDEKYGEIDEHEISMPYLSGRDIVDISKMFGMTASYSMNGGNLSRWMYLEELLSYCIENNRVSDLLVHLFSKNQFQKKLDRCSAEQIDFYHRHIIDEIIEKINGILYFGGNKLVSINGQFDILSIDSVMEIKAPTIKSIDHNYIKEISDRAMQDVVNTHYDSAITKSRTLLEEVFCYVIEKKDEVPSKKGDIVDLYKQVKDLHSMHANRETDKRINSLLSGLNKIIQSIVEMRNNNSDAHGVGSRRIKISEHHARLMVNSAMIVADFILSIGKINQK